MTGKEFGALVRAARDLLNWRQSDLAYVTGLSEVTLTRVEREGRFSEETKEIVKDALETSGIQFVSTTGRQGVIVRLRDRKKARKEKGI